MKNQNNIKAVLKQVLAAASALALAGTPAMAQTAAQLTRIGGAGAVRGSVNAIAPNTTVGREVVSGKPLYLNDHVTTKADSHLQVMLLDETVFTMGPDSDMVLDEFVYDPSTNAGKVTARLTKGVFRFVSGKVARQGADRMKINVPTGTIGIRGTAGVISVTPDGDTIILTGAGLNNTAGAPPGHMHVENKYGSQELKKVPFGIHMTLGAAPTTPANMEKELAQLGALVASRARANNAPPTGTGGGKKVGAAQQTGADVFAGLGGLQTTNSLGQQTNQSSLLTTQAQQDNSASGSAAGPVSWDTILSQLRSGIGTYNGSGSYSANTSGTLSLNLTVNFGQTYYSGSFSFSGGSANGDSISIPSTDFNTLHGSAKIPVSGSDGTVGSYNGSIQLMNAGGTIAKQAAASLTFSGNTIGATSGSVTATR